MIVTVTLNFALDVTYRTARVEVGTTARVEVLGRQAGGKGVNVARVLHTLGREVTVTGFAGGAYGAAARRELVAAGLRDATVDIGGDSRLAFIVVDEAGAATGFSELGAEITPEEWASLIARVRALAGEAEAVVLSGSVPPSVPVDGYRQLVEAAHAGGSPVLLDADGAALQRALSARPELVKINRAELAGVFDDEDLVAGARRLRATGPRTVIITDGAAGLLLLGEGPVLRAAPPAELRGNPTGAGDAAAAALVAAMVDGSPWEEALADAAALSAAAVAAPLAGHFDPAIYAELRTRIKARASRG